MVFGQPEGVEAERVDEFGLLEDFGIRRGRRAIGHPPPRGVGGQQRQVPDAHGSLYRVSADGRTVAGPWRLPAANPFTLAAYAGRLWIANFGGTDVLVVNPARLPGS